MQQRLHRCGAPGTSETWAGHAHTVDPRDAKRAKYLDHQSSEVLLLNTIFYQRKQPTYSQLVNIVVQI
jgi:hypothetical protein